MRMSFLKNIVVGALSLLLSVSAFAVSARTVLQVLKDGGTAIEELVARSAVKGAAARAELSESLKLTSKIISERPELLDQLGSTSEVKTALEKLATKSSNEDIRTVNNALIDLAERNQAGASFKICPDCADPELSTLGFRTARLASKSAAAALSKAPKSPAELDVAITSAARAASSKGFTVRASAFESKAFSALDQSRKELFLEYLTILGSKNDDARTNMAKAIHRVSSNPDGTFNFEDRLYLTLFDEMDDAQMGLMTTVFNGAEGKNSEERRAAIARWFKTESERVEANGKPNPDRVAAYETLTRNDCWGIFRR